MNIERLRQQLTERLSELEGRLASVRQDLRKSHSADSAEQAQERENEEVESAIGVEAEQSIREIRLALERLESGNYGECERCGEPIPEARLLARPETTRCVACAE